MNNLHSYVGPLITCSIILGLLSLHVVNRFKNIVFKRLLILCIATIWWHGAWVFLFLTQDESLALFIAKVGHVGILFLPIAFLQLYEAMTGVQRKSYIYDYAVFTSFLALLFFTGTIVSGIAKFDWGYYPIAGAFHPLFLAQITIYVGRSLYITLLRLKQSKKDLDAKRLRVAAIAGLVFTMASYDFLINYSLVSTYPYGFICSIVFILIVSYGIIEYDLFAKEVAIENIKSKLSSLEGEVEVLDKSVDNLRAELIQKEKLASLGLISSGIAHQLGNTLNVISTNLTSQKMALKRNSLKPEFLEKSIQRMFSAIELSKDIINSISAFSKENDNLRTNSLREIVESGILLSKGKSGERVKFFNHINSSINIYCSKSSLTQVFMNLFSNAIDAMKNKGEIKIYITNDNRSECEIVVEDQGPGISEHLHESLFDAFVTGKEAEDGTGLGLYLVKKELEKNNGDVWFDSNDRGTKFYLKLKKEPQNENKIILS